LGKWTIKLLCLLLGLLCLIICPANGANLETEANTQSQLDVILDNSTLSFPVATIGKISEERRITAQVKGSGLYRLYIQATVLKADDSKELPAAVLEFKEKSESDWLPASSTSVPVLTTPAMAKAGGDQREIAFRLNIPPSAKAGLYSCEVTITASVMASVNEDVGKDVNKSVNTDVYN